MGYYYLYKFVNLIFMLAEFILLARVIISWLPVDRYNRYVNLLYRITEPVLAPFRRMLDRTPFGGNTAFDFSPLIVLLIIGILRNIVIKLLVVLIY